jgi:hypothetical protein
LCQVSSPADYQVLDARAGDGLWGVALQKQGFVHIEANDLSPKMVLELAAKDKKMLSKGACR